MLTFGWGREMRGRESSSLCVVGIAVERERMDLIMDIKLMDFPDRYNRGYQIVLVSN